MAGDYKEICFMLDKIRESKNGILPWIVIIVALYIMTLLQIPMAIRNVFLVLSTACCLLALWESNRTVKWEVIVLILGLLARIVFCYLDACTEFRLPIDGGNDGLAFMSTAVEYYNGDFHREYTKYPYILYAIFQITGVNQYAAQYVNVLCWAFSAVIIQKISKRLNICGNLRLIAIIVISWLPTNIWITSVLYRDVYIMLFLLISFYYLLCWIHEGKYRNILYSVSAVLIATILHGGSIVNLLPIGVTIVFYSREKKSFEITQKSLMFCLSIVGVGILLFLIPEIRDTILKKLPSMENGIIEGVNDWLAMKYDYSEGAGSNYMEGRYLKGYFDIVVMTAQKLYYHMFSPVPHMWRGIVDAVAFIMSSAPIYFVTVLLWSVSFFYKRIDAIRFVMFLEVFITTGIYAWANVNGGTAIRHREKILGLMMLLAMYALNIIIQKRKERKSIENVTKK